MRRLALILVIFLLPVQPALAHAGGQPIAPADVWHHWTFDPLIWAPLLVSHWLYGRGVLRAWRRAGVGRVFPIWRAGCFAAGELVLAWVEEVLGG